MAERLSKGEVDAVLGNLTGPVQQGKRYLFFTVTFHFMGVVKEIQGSDIILEKGAMIIVSTGSQNKQLSKIIAGSAKPETYEVTESEIIINKNGVVATFVCS